MLRRYIAISKDLFKRYGALNVITWMFAIVAVTLPLGVRITRSDNLQAVGSVAWIAVLYIIIVPTVAAYYLNAWALTESQQALLLPYISSAVIAFICACLGERLSLRNDLRRVLIFAASASWHAAAVVAFET